VGHDALVELIFRLDALESFPVQNFGDLPGGFASHMKFLPSKLLAVDLRAIRGLLESRCVSFVQI